MRTTFEKRLLFLVICLLTTWFSANAQLSAAFTADIAGGCSPLVVHFTNTSNASSSAVYKWDFGNGNTSTLKDPGAIFNEEGEYIVTLNITDDNKTSTATHTITVFEKPSVDFAVSIQKGCVPLSVDFTFDGGNSDANIANYYWDFGDGLTTSTGSDQTTHSYSQPSTTAVSLTVTDIHGCQNTIRKTDLIQVLPELAASFELEEKVLCNITDPAVLINNSFGPGTLTYQWDFGDGTSSSLTAPSHVYAAKGIYDIGLTVTSSEGCTASVTNKNAINAANFNSEFSVSDPVCDMNAAQFDNKSFPAPDHTTWQFSDGYNYYTTGNDPVVRSFSNPADYQVKITNTFGSCTEVVTRDIPVRKSQEINGFITNVPACGAPVEVYFEDTTASAIDWLWTSSGYPFGEGKRSLSSQFTYDGTYYITLQITDTAGCKSSTTKQIKISRPKVTVSSPEDIQGNGEVASCGPKLVHFVATSSDPISSYFWNFADGTTSDEASPAHQFNKTGEYPVTLDYVTVDGCKGSLNFPFGVFIRDSVKVDFEIPATVCGNNAVTIKNLSPKVKNYHYQWYFGDGFYEQYFYNSLPTYISHQYRDTGYFSVTLIATNAVCADTLVKTNAIKVSAPIPKITGVINTCEGTRGDVILTNGSIGVVSGTWDFGDGTTAPYTDEPEIKHTYNKTGSYKVVLRTTNGDCTTADSVVVYVLLKQHPTLSADKTSACFNNDHITLTYSNLEENPNPSGTVAYGLPSWLHGDYSSAMSGGGMAIPTSTFTFNVSTFRGFERGEGLISIIQSANFGCYDTTNTIPLTIKGPFPGFSQVGPDLCEGSTTVVIQDSSKSSSDADLVLWNWYFPNGQSLADTTGGPITHDFRYPGVYSVGLIVTDADGCSDYANDYVRVETNPLKASFHPSVTVLSPGSTITFTNTTQTLNSPNTSYEWLFGDGTGANTRDAAKTFTTPGEYTVTLIARNDLTGCSDTATAKITVKFINAAFAFNSSHISNSKCLPVVVNFANTSSNVSHISWEFGDGSGAVDVFNPSHVYTTAGRYIVKVTTYSDNGTSYTTEDSVIINEASVDFVPDASYTCTDQSIGYHASPQNVISYTWDFGDGTIFTGGDSVATHQYLSAGMYVPNLIVTDANGCNVQQKKADAVYVGSLDVSLQNVPDKICAPKTLNFSPDIRSISGDPTVSTLTYFWSFGTGNPGDTSAIANPDFLYQQTGNYAVSLRVQSEYGCVREVTKDVVAFQGLAPYINGPAEICESTSALFTGELGIPGQPTWKWIFDDGEEVNQQNPPERKYDEPGEFSVKLIVDNNGCIDTISQQLLVHAKPSVTLSTAKEEICEGSTISITATGGNVYHWTPADGLNITNGATVTASPSSATTYGVTVTDAFGCTNNDFVRIEVIHPFVLQAPSDVTLCSGESIRLEVSGGITYQWIGHTDGLNNLTVANPVAMPGNTSTYTVVATGEKNCFTDTASIKVTVNPTPIVHLGNDTTLCQGQSLTLNAFNNNATYNWQDGSTSSIFVVKNAGEYHVKVNLDNCTSSDTIVIRQTTLPYFTLGKDTTICEGEEYILHPLLSADASFLWQDGSDRPSFTVTKEGAYSLTATNQCGSYSGSVIITSTGICHIMMPTAFSPNFDGLNDVFKVKYPFAVKAFKMVLYNRWGQKVFETNNIREGWNGYWKGEPSVQGTYIWIITYTDTHDKSEQLKGTVTLLR